MSSWKQTHDIGFSDMFLAHIPAFVEVSSFNLGNLKFVACCSSQKVPCVGCSSNGRFLWALTVSGVTKINVRKHLTGNNPLVMCEVTYSVWDDHAKSDRKF